MAVSTTGDVYSWGATGGGRIGIKTSDEMVPSPQKVTIKDANNNDIKAVDVECGYVHSMIVGCDGSLYMCGGVGIDGDEDGQHQEELKSGETSGKRLLLRIGTCIHTYTYIYEHMNT
jgi:alpha-tubulin suppressor-like RCC1 family protein